MSDYSLLVDKILESDDYLSVLRESKNFNVKTFDELVKILTDYDERVKKKDIETKLEVSPEEGKLKWFVNQGYMDDKDRTLSILSFDNGKVNCDENERFRTPGSTNLNDLADINQILKLIDIYVSSLEKDDKKPEDDKEEKTPEEKEDEEFTLDDSIVRVLDKLKTEGESIISKYKSTPPLNYNGKDYKIDKGVLMASTEKELVISLEFPKEQEIDIYATTSDGRKLRTALVNHFEKNGFKKNPPQFRYDMDGTAYFYTPVGSLPVKKTTGPEARAILNYYDGQKVRFQPKEKG